MAAPPAEKTSNVSSAILNAGVQHKEEPQAQAKPAAQQEEKAPRDKARYSPAVLTLAAEHNIDLSLVTGSGVGGRITRKDLQAIIASGQIPTAPAQTEVASTPSAEQAPASNKYKPQQHQRFQPLLAM